MTQWQAKREKTREELYVIGLMRQAADMDARVKENIKAAQESHDREFFSKTIVTVLKRLGHKEEELPSQEWIEQAVTLYIRLGEES